MESTEGPEPARSDTVKAEHGRKAAARTLGKAADLQELRGWTVPLGHHKLTHPSFKPLLP